MAGSGVAREWACGAEWCIMMYDIGMGSVVRQSVSLPTPTVKRVRAIAKARRTSANRVLVDLIETGLQAKEAEKAQFLDLARRFKEATDPEESERLREELARLTFGE
jgi:hypothetical protein